MGRKSLNKTYQQVLEEKRIRSRQYYSINKDRIKREAVERYNKLKNKG